MRSELHVRELSHISSQSHTKLIKILRPKEFAKRKNDKVSTKTLSEKFELGLKLGQTQHFDNSSPPRLEHIQSMRKHKTRKKQEKYTLNTLQTLAVTHSHLHSTLTYTHYSTLYRRTH
jgi:hypothetical protein